jgi:prepilin-type N-terminal cleavage/methylation domain-containing protein
MITMNVARAPQPLTTARRPRGARRAAPAAFTLTEMLVVIGIIVLVALLAIPSFRALSGGRSTEAAQNVVSAVLSRARTEALGLQQARGVLFYRDTESGRVAMTFVRSTEVESADSPVSVAAYRLDLVPDRDVVLLPQGVGIQFIDDEPDDRYVGFNTRTDSGSTNNETVVPYGGVVMFDTKGRLVSDTYAFRLSYPGPPARASELARFLMDDPARGGGTPTVVDPTPLPFSKIGFVLFDEEEFAAVFREGREADTTEENDSQVDERVTFGTPTNPAGGTPDEADEEMWLDENAVPILINRYNGTLVRGQ